jgi:hypothetical protein
MAGVITYFDEKMQEILGKIGLFFLRKYKALSGKPYLTTFLHNKNKYKKYIGIMKYFSQNEL